MGLAGDVLVFIADCEPICALQAHVEILQAAANESRARDGHFRSTSSGPLRLLRWSRGDRAGLKVDVQIWVTWRNHTLLYSFSAHRLYPGTTRLHRSQGLKLKTLSCWTTPLLRCTVQPKLLSLAFDMQADLPTLPISSSCRVDFTC